MIELFQKDLPITVENFKSLITGERGENKFYKSRSIHRVIPGFMMQGGKILNKNGTGH